MQRRTFFSTSLGLASWWAFETAEAAPRPSKLPRWRGFNLLEKFNPNQAKPYSERDFEWMHQWGFDFVRLPMSYWCWSKPDLQQWILMDEMQLKEIDQVVEWGKTYKIHVNLNMHRIPGYCVNPPAEPLDLWKDEKALEAACHHWRTFAIRYKGISNKRLSFDLLNEPPDIPEADYERVVRALVKAIRDVDAQRLIIADGLRWGTTPVHSIVDLNVGQSTRGYNPMQVSHYRASWVKASDQWPTPDWPLKIGETDWNKDLLKKKYIAPWKELERKGVGIHVGEWGAFQHTPHATALKWMEDNLQLWKEAGWGWSLWNLRGSFGILDSGRKDVVYEDWHGSKLDRKMLELLRRY